MFLFKQEYKLQPKTWLFKDNKESTKLTVTAQQWYNNETLHFKRCKQNQTKGH